MLSRHWEWLQLHVSACTKPQFSLDMGYHQSAYQCSSGLPTHGMQELMWLLSSRLQHRERQVHTVVCGVSDVVACIDKFSRGPPPHCQSLALQERTLRPSLTEYISLSGVGHVDWSARRHSFVLKNSELMSLLANADAGVIVLKLTLACFSRQKQGMRVSAAATPKGSSVSSNSLVWSSSRACA